MNSHKNLPLKCKKILLTRPLGKNRLWSEYLSALGARPLSYPLFQFVPTELEPKRELFDYDGIILTSSTASEFLADKLKKLGANNLSLLPPVFCLSQKVAQPLLPQLKKQIQATTEQKSAREFALFLASNLSLSQKRFLYPCSERAGRQLEKILTNRGATVERWHLYRLQPIDSNSSQTKRPPIIEELDAVIFASPSAVEFFLQKFGVPNPSAPRPLWIAIGETTAKKLKAHNFQSFFTAKQPTIESIAQLLAEKWGQK